MTSRAFDIPAASSHPRHHPGRRTVTVLDVLKLDTTPSAQPRKPDLETFPQLNPRKDKPSRRNRAQRLVSYLVKITPPGNVRVSTRFRFTQLSSAVKNGVPPPTRTGWVTISYSSISPARMTAPASVAPPTLIGPPSSALSRVISAIASPVTRRVFQSTLSIVEENTTFGVSRQFRANSICAGVAPGCWSPVGQ